MEQKEVANVRANSTKTLLATTLKAMMQTMDLDHVTIEELTRRAGVTRNTFYYHFDDIYSLLKWIYDQEVVAELRAHAQIDEWQTAYRVLLDYIDDNRQFCIASFHSVGRDLLEQLLYSVSQEMVLRVVHDVDADVPQPITRDITDFYGLAIVAQVIKWLMEGLVESKDTLIQRADIMLRGGIANAIRNGREHYGFYALPKSDLPTK
jgi:AcrR family transcriptional regulator